MNKKKILVVNRHPPYGSSLAKESLDAVLAASAYEQDIGILFIGDGVFQLKKSQNATALEVKNIGSILPVLPLYDIEKFYIQSSALLARGLTEKDLVLPVQSLKDDEIAELMNQQDVLLSF